jgi:hypothetical protein
VPSDEASREDHLDKVNSKLNEGLETCRSMIENYRTLLSGETGDKDGPEDEEDSSETDAE